MAGGSKDISKIELYANSLYPGMILKGDLFTMDGIKVFSANEPLTAEVIQSLLSNQVKKVFYTRPSLFTNSGKPAMMSKDILERAFAISEEIGYAVVKKTHLPEKDIGETVEQFIDKVLQAEKGALLNIIEIKDYNEHVYVHSVNVCMISILMATQMHWKHDMIKTIGIGALLHDIGKMMVPNEILNKKEKLTNEEFDIIKKHPVYGYNILKSQSGFEEPIIKIALLHHECFDGSGYPLGIGSDKIDDFSQIVSLCDFYEALTTDKVYRGRMEFWKAFLMIRKNMVTKFNPRFAIEFINKMPAYLIEKSIISVGDYVMLNTQEMAEVTCLSENETLKPSVKIFNHPNGEYLKYPLLINLENDNQRWIENIIEDPNTLNVLKSIQR